MRVSGHKEHFRICHFSIQGNHVHLLVEATDVEALAAGMQGFKCWTARRLNQLAGRRGHVFEDRSHHHVLRTKREVRAALRYVLSNWRRHDCATGDIDPFSSGDLFTGWRGWHGARHRDGVLRPRWLDEDEPIPVAAPRSWLLRTGWLDAGGPLSPFERP